MKKGGEDNVGGKGMAEEFGFRRVSMQYMSYDIRKGRCSGRKAL